MKVRKMKTGPKPMAPKNKHSKLLAFRLRPEEHAAVTRKAKPMSAALFARRVTLEAANWNRVK